MDSLTLDRHDGVDGRQIVSALSFGKMVLEDLGMQYIVTMNSDIFDALPAS